MSHASRVAAALEAKEDAGSSTALATVDKNTDLIGELPEEGLEEARRWKGINVGGDTVTQSTEGLPDHQRALIRWLHDYARTRDLTWPQIEEATGISRTVIFRVFKGEYVYPPTYYVNLKVNGVMEKTRVPHPKAGQSISLDGVCEKIEKAKRNSEKEQSLFSVGFLRTSVWERVEWACQKALDKHRIVFVYGEGQIGKTTCGEEFARQHNGGTTTFIRIPPSGGVQALCKVIAKALHVNASRCHDALLDDVLRALDKSKLLIFDEIHEIFITYPHTSVLRCMELLRYIYDKTHCGMVLMGTNTFSNALKEGEFFQFLKQLHRRGLYEVRLPDFTPLKDLQLAVTSYGLEWPKNAALEQELLHLGETGFGQVLTRLEDGKGVADKAGRDYTWKDFIKARDIVRGLTLKPEPEKVKVLT